MAIHHTELPNANTLLKFFFSFYLCSKSKGKGGQEDEKQRYEEECKPQQETAVEKPWTLPYDAQFNKLIKETFKSVVPLQREVEMYTALAE